MALRLRTSAASDRPLAWLAGLAVVIVALLCLQFDRATSTPSPLASVIESVAFDGPDNGDEDVPPLDHGRLTLPALFNAPRPAPSLRAPLGERRSKQAFFLPLSARGPPVANF